MLRIERAPEFGIAPVEDAAVNQGHPIADDYLPFFSCKAVGDVLLEVAQSYPRCQTLVIYGHTHDGGEIQATETLRVGPGPAEYGYWKVVNQLANMRTREEL